LTTCKAALTEHHGVLRRLDKTKFLYVGAGLFSVGYPGCSPAFFHIAW
jgi:hypothetical protein